MQPATKIHVRRARTSRHDEYATACAKIKYEAHKAGRFGGGTYFLDIIGASYEYARHVFADLLEVEEKALKFRLIPWWGKGYFDGLKRSMAYRFQADFWQAVMEQLSSTSFAERYPDPTKTPLVQEELGKRIDQINTLVSDSVDALRGRIRRDGKKAMWRLITVLIAILIGIAGVVLGNLV